MIEQAFEVATEFKFDVGQALISTGALQGAVDDVSKSANTAMASLNYLASGLVAHLGFGSGGLLSVLTKAVQVSEAFNQTSLQFSNNILSNFQVLSGTINTFNDRLSTSQMIMGNIQKAAVNAGLDAGALAHITQLVSSPLAARQKLGTNYEGGISMAKNMMIASEAVGLPQQMGSESLVAALSGSAMHGKLFERLVNTSAFRSAGIRSQGQFGPQVMNQDKRIDLLTKALEELGGNADYLRYRMQQMGTQLTVLKDQLEIILKPIGDAILKPIKAILFGVNEYLKNHGKEIGDNLAKLIGNIFDDPRKLFVNIMQLKNLGGDFKKALHLTELFQLFLFLKWGLGKLGIELTGGLLRRGLTFLIEGLQMLGTWIWNVGILGKVFGLLKSAVAEVLPIFASFLFIFQILSRARGIAKLADIENLATLTPRISALLVKLKTALENIMLPINMAIDFWAKLLAPLFETSTWLNILVPVFEGFATLLGWVGQAVIILMSVLSGFSMMVIGFVDDIIHLKNPFSAAASNFMEGFHDFMTAHGMGGDMNKAVVNQVTNVGKIEARFDMREQMEPDRIAFAVTTHLKKLAMNPTQGRGQSLGGAFTGSQTIAGNAR